MAFVYILRNQESGRFYVGCTENVLKRLGQHNHGQVKSTKAFRPWSLVLEQNYDKLSMARKIEKRLKDMKRKDYLEKIVKEGAIKMEL